MLNCKQNHNNISLEDKSNTSNSPEIYTINRPAFALRNVQDTLQLPFTKGGPSKGVSFSHSQKILESSSNENQAASAKENLRFPRRAEDADDESSGVSLSIYSTDEDGPMCNDHSIDLDEDDNEVNHHYQEGVAIRGSGHASYPESSSPFPTILDDLDADEEGGEDEELVVGIPEEEVHYLRFRSQFRLKTAWEKICEKYGKNYDDEADEIDIFTGKIIVDRGCVKKRPCIEIGTLTQEVDDTGVDDAWADPEVRENFRKSQKMTTSEDLHQSSVKKEALEMQYEFEDDNNDGGAEGQSVEFRRGEDEARLYTIHPQESSQQQVVLTMMEEFAAPQLPDRKYFEIDAPHDYFPAELNLPTDPNSTMLHLQQEDFIESYLVPSPPLKEICHQESAVFPGFQAIRRVKNKDRF